MQLEHLPQDYNGSAPGASGHHSKSLASQSMCSLILLAPLLTRTLLLIEAELKQVQAENNGLAQGLQIQREEVERLVTGLEAVVRDLEAANEAMDVVVEDENMRKDVADMEEELRDLGREREMKL